jgi:uncharacterized coiled-coil protein SlyX
MTISFQTLRASCLLLAAVLLATSQAMAAGSGPRYELRETGSNEFIRLDTETGNVSVCSRDSGNWVCKSAADDRKAYQDEIARLENRNRQLELKVATLEKKLQGKTATPELQLPDEATIDKMMSFLRSIMEKFMDMARDLENRPDRA